MKPLATCWDLDGTLASCEWRRHYLDENPPDWKGFFADLNADAPVPAIVEWLHSVPAPITRILVSGRPDNYRYQTEWWLTEHGIIFDELHMRKAGDQRQDDVVKQEILVALQRRYEVLYAVDDRPMVISMWLANGVTCFEATDPGLPPILPPDSSLIDDPSLLPSPHPIKQCSHRTTCSFCLPKMIRTTQARSPLAILIHGFAEVFWHQWGEEFPRGISESVVPKDESAVPENARDSSLQDSPLHS